MMLTAEQPTLGWTGAVALSNLECCPTFSALNEFEAFLGMVPSINSPSH